MVIRGFIWDINNNEHIARHEITPTEVDEILEHPVVVTKDRFNRFGLFGVSNSGKYLVVIIEPRDNDLYYVITAFPMDKAYKEFYMKEVSDEER